MNIKNTFFQKEALKYLLIGVLAFIVDYGSLVISYYLFNLPLALSTTIGFFLGFLVSFISNRYWVFGNNGSSKKPTLQIIQYTVLVIFNYIFTILFIKITDHFGVEPSISKVLVMVIIVVWNFLIFQKIIFSENKDK